MAVGKIVGVSRDFVSGKMIISFAFNEDVSEQYEELKDKEKITIELKVFRRKRSLDANAYLWVLCTKIAGVIESSKDEVYNQMLSRYGQFEVDDDGKTLCFQMLSKFDAMMIKRTDIHVKAIGNLVKEGKEITSYALLRGSSTYDTCEMSKLIDGIISECKELNIETITPNEIERIKQQWGIDV